QAMLQKMFPKEGEKEPEVRFEGFEGEWEENSLGDIADLQNGYAFKSTQYIENGKYGILTISNVQGNRYIDTSGYHSIGYIPKDVQSHQLLKKDDIVISMTGNVGRVSIVNIDNMLLNQRVGLISPKRGTKTNKDFLFTVLNSSSFERRMIES